MIEKDAAASTRAISDSGMLSRAAQHIDEAPRVIAVFRPFSVVSFVAIAVTAVLLTVCYRYESIQNIRAQADAGNLVVAQSAMASIHEDIADYLGSIDGLSGGAFPEAMAKPLFAIIDGTKVRKVKIYDRRGVVVFSTVASEVGVRRMDNPRVVRALGGDTATKLIYRDRFNSIGGGDAEDNLVQTYVPLQKRHSGPFIGVFEIYTDVSEMVAKNEQTEIIIASTAMIILMLLYFSLQAFVRRIERVIITQEESLRERSELLAALLARMLDSQENEKHRIAAELHERVAQTLAAVKLSVESAVHTIGRGEEVSVKHLESMIPVLQSATQDVRLVAVGLRPPSLDDLGLVATLRWLCREIAEKHPQIALESHLDLAEERRIPASLKAIIYRVAEDSGAALAANAKVRRIAVSLDANKERIILTVRDDGLEDGPINKDHPYASARERTLASGGNFLTLGNAWGGVNMMATWLV